MPAIPEYVQNSAPPVSAERLNQPFHVRAATYDLGTDTITVTVGEGRVDWGEGNVTEFTAPEVVAITPVSASTVYYVHLQSNGTLEASTSDMPSRPGATLGTVTTDAAKQPTRGDLRGMLPVPPYTRVALHMGVY